MAQVQPVTAIHTVQPVMIALPVHCGCCSYRAMAFVAATICIIEAVSEMILAFLLCQEVRCNNYGSYDNTYYYDSCGGSIYYYSGSDCYTTSVWTSTASFIQASVTLICSIMLILGTSKMNPGFLSGYTIIMAMNCAAYLIEGIVCIASMDAIYVYYAVNYLVWAPFIAYFIWIVHNHRNVMIQQLTRQMAAVPAFYPAAPMMMSSAGPGVVFANQQMVAPVGNMYHASPNVAHVSGAYVNQQMAAPVGNMYHASPNVAHVSGTYPPPLVQSPPPPYKV